MVAPLFALVARGGGLVLFGVLVPILVIGLVAYGIWELVRAGRPASAGAATAALAVLDERLARGEIEPEDYRQRRELLEGPPPAPPTVPAAGPDPAAGSDPVE